ncbi:acyltransferase family protein [Sellimonas catena]|uniref:Acyltransferase 3 domain-containing protein n=1 Tax=Sellimonas catena TaxID=2994035 RepID=A0A9W6CBT2_9FIRM|nr:acyltransferase [Sellimonas catena]GLG06300.1 hypothetical protein Selli1_34740 [Sellimonas catena]
MNQKANRYAQIDVLEFVFAILIVCLHISGNDQESIVYLIGQYISRIGVPFFFTVSGFFAYQKVKSELPKVYLKRQEVKLVRIFLIWTIIYMPINFRTVFVNYDKNIVQAIFAYVRSLILEAPSYMWYLVALMIALIPFVIYGTSHLTKYTIGALIFYIIGTLLNSYRTIVGFDSLNPFYDLFVTSRNGIFFPPIFLAIGGWVNIIYRKKKDIKMWGCASLIAYILFVIEVTYVINQVPKGEDCSMYFSLPIVTMMLFTWALLTFIIRESKITSFCKRASLTVYCSQYGFIFVWRKLIGNDNEFMLWLLVVLSGCILTCGIVKFKKCFSRFLRK